MTDSIATALVALSTARASEMEALRRYLKFARQTTEPSGKNMFTQLALEESDHFILLDREIESLRERGEWMEVTVDEQIIHKIMPTLDQRSLRTQGQNGLNQMAALSTALEHEDRAIRYYETQRDALDHAQARKIFGWLAEMEKAHYDLIQAQIDNIKTTGLWFGVPGFDLEGND